MKLSSLAINLSLEWINILWILYNSTAMKSVVGLVMLGNVGALFAFWGKIGRHRTPANGMAYSPFIDFNRRRKAAKWWTVLVALTGFLPVICYGVILGLSDGKADNLHPNARGWVLILYGLTFVALAITGLFSMRAIDLLRESTKLDDDITQFRSISDPPTQR